MNFFDVYNFQVYFYDKYNRENRSIKKKYIFFELFHENKIEILFSH